MAMNVNNLNQNNNYGMGKDKVDTEYSSFKMNYTIESTGDMGTMIPIHVQEMLPSQKVALNQTIGIQFMPFVSNLFHEINGETLTYFVPMRLMWNEWEEFITGGIEGTNTSVHPTINLGTLYSKLYNATTNPNPLRGTFVDYLGLPINSVTAENYTTFVNGEQDNPSAFPLYAYNLIYNEHIRIIDSEREERQLDDNTLFRSNYDWDYFTRARVYQQRGIIPSIPISDELAQLTHDWEFWSSEGTTYTYLGKERAQSLNVRGNDTTLGQHQTTLYGDIQATANAPKNSLRTTEYDRYGVQQNTSYTTALEPHNLEELGLNLNDLMIGLGIMAYQIHNAKVQPRYIDQLNIRWGIYPQDARLQRPEYLGSNYFNIAVDTVTQTAPSTSSTSTEQGNITGQGWGNGQNLKADYVAQEHGILITLMTVRPKGVYEGGLNKIWNKKTKFDYATPELANLPDVPVYTQELYYSTDEDTNKTIFGYQNIYEEYRTRHNIVSGRLRPTENDNLASYTLARYWDSENIPALNKIFMECDPDQDRILQYTDEPCFIYFIRNQIATAVPLPMQSDPAQLNI